jgi:DNA-directed RNA polymerase subunit RPC12/RpoP
MSVESEKFQVAKRKAALSLWVALFFALFFIVAFFVIYAFGFDVKRIPSWVQILGSAMTLLIPAIFVAVADAYYRCPTCGKRPFPVVGYGLTHTYSAQQELSRAIAEGKCVHCGSQLTERKSFFLQRRKW